MVKDDGTQWLLELTQNITHQLKENKEEIAKIWEDLAKRKDMHIICREQLLNRLAELDNELLEKFSNLDKRLEITIIKTGLIISVIIVLAQYLFNHLLGK